jgi:hypothetical protein
MKLKSLLFGLSATTFLGGSAYAQTVLYVVGSTAYRPAATAAIIAYLSANSSGGAVNGASTSSASPATAGGLFGAGNGYFTNSSGSIVVKTNWTGSAAGLVDVVSANATQDFFIPTGTTLSPIVIPGLDASSGATPSYGAQVASSAVTENDIPNLTFSDSFKASVAGAVSTATLSGSVGTATKANQLAALINGTNVQNAGTSAGAGNQDAVGIIPFAWYAGNGASSGITNVTQESIASLIAGPTRLNFFTGNSGDVNNYVFLIGRNEDSGTRIGGFAEAQQGFGKGCDQFELTFSGTSTMGKITTSSGTTTTLPTGGIAATVSGGMDFTSTAKLYTEPKVGWNTSGHSGYASGGDVANVLLAKNSSPGTLNIDGYGGNEYLIGYLGFADGYGLTNPSSGSSTGYALTYNGVAGTVANIQNGEYTYWGYEHMYYVTSGTNAIGANQGAADGIADLVFNTYASTNGNGVTAPSTDQVEKPPVAGILYNTVGPTRTQEGAPLSE